MERRVLISMPDASARRELIRLCTIGQTTSLSDEELDILASRSEGMSGADLNCACREAAMRPVRRLILEVGVEALQGLQAQGGLGSWIPQVIKYP